MLDKPQIFQPSHFVSESPPRKSSIAGIFGKRGSKSSSRASIDSRRSSVDLEEDEKPPSASQKLRKRLTGGSLDSAKPPPLPKRFLKKTGTAPPSTSPPPPPPPPSVPAPAAPEPWERDKQTGEVKDHTNMLHSLAYEYDFDPTFQQLSLKDPDAPLQPGEAVVSKLPLKQWNAIMKNFNLVDAASFSLACIAFRSLLDYDPVPLLNDPDNYQDRINFLVQMDKQFPAHLLCFNCAKYHVRTQAGHERLKKTNIANKIYDCPYIGSTDPDKKISRVRITFARTLPFPFAQLITRESRFGPTYGISAEASMGRRYTDPVGAGSTWNHITTYAVIGDHLYMRVKSVCFAPPGLPPAGERKLLYCSQEEFYPFFSVCEHWKQGELMPSAKCAIRHIPKPIEGSGIARVGKEIQSQYIHRRSVLVTQCDNCKPIRRCPKCPTEYLMEIRWEEDKAEQDPLQKFKYALVVTRWSDLGDGKVPWGPEWAACIRENDAYDSFKTLGRRAINGVFESYMSPEQIPPQRLVSLNPTGETGGDRWW